MILLALYFPSESIAASPVQGFSEEMQFQLIQHLFEDGLYYSAQKEANNYLNTFPEGPSRETVLFLHTRANELQSGNIQEAVKGYNQYRLTYPNGRWIKDSMFFEGSLVVRLGQYRKGISILEEYLDKFPDSDHRENALYWLGKTAFYSAESARQDQLFDISEPLYQKVATALLKISKPNRLIKEHQIDRMYFIGWSYHFQQKTQEAQKWLLEYVNQAQDRSNISTIYYHLGENERKVKNYKKAITFYEKLTLFPEFPLLNHAIYLIAEGRYLMFKENPPEKNQRPHIENIISLFQAYLTTEDQQHKAAARSHIAGLYYQLGKKEWETENYQEAITFFEKLTQFPEFPLLNLTIFLNAKGHYLIFERKPPEKNQRSHIERIISLFQNYLKTGDQEYKKDAHSYIAAMYYRLGQNEWEAKNYQKAISFFEKLNQYPDSQYFNSAIFSKAEVHYLNFQKEPPEKDQKIHIGKIIDLYQAYLKTGDQKYQKTAHTRIAEIYYQLGQNEWEAKNYQEAITFFEKLISYPGSPPQYKENAHARIAEIYYQLGQSEWEAKNYQEAITFFEKLKQFPNSEHFNPAIFSNAEMYYLIFLEKPLTKNRSSNLKTIISLYESYLKTEDQQYKATTYYRLGSLHVNNNEQNKAITNYQQYLKSGETTHAADAHYELGRLYSEKNDYTQAIKEFQLARHSETYQNDGALIQLLVQLFEKTNQQRELQALLAEAKENKALKGQDRSYFLLQAVSIALQNNNCSQVLKDLKEIPSSYKQADQHYLLYARGSCYIQQKQWEQAEIDLVPLIQDPEYEKLVFELLIATYQGAKKWEKLAQHIEEFWQRENFPPQTQHFQILVSTYHQLQDWQKIVATYTRWESVFKQDVEKPEPLINWAEAEEKLEHIEQSRILYERALSLDTSNDFNLREKVVTPFPDIYLKDTSVDFNLRETIVARLADSYLKDGDYHNYTRIYEHYLMPYLTDPKIQQQYAFALGRVYYEPLKEYEEARRWFQEADQGQVTDLEIEANILLSAIEEAEGNTAQAIQILNDLLKRSLEQTKWNLIINHQLGSLYDSQKQWSDALKKYRIVAGHSPITEESEKVLQKEAQERIGQIERYFTRIKLDRFIEQEAWKQVAQMIRDGLKKKHFSPSHELYETLVHAESQQENWEDILSAYQEWRKLDSSKAESFEALLTQGQAADHLSDIKLTKQFYGKALNLVPVKDLQNRIFLTERLGEIYEQENNYEKVVELYEKTYPFLQKRQDQIRFSYKIGEHYLTHLKQEKQVRKWFTKTDMGGISVEELSAIWYLAEMETNQEKAIKMLARLASRPISKQPDWYILLNYKLGILYGKEGEWPKAKIHFDRVAKAKPSKIYGAEQKIAKGQSAEIAKYLKELNESQ